MKTKDIASEYGLNKERFETFLRQPNRALIYDGMLEMTLVDDADISAIVKEFKIHEDDLIAYEKRRPQEEAALTKRKVQEEADEEVRLQTKNAALASMLITSGFNFDGYTITKYSGYISGDDAISVDRGMAIFGSGTNIKDKLMESLVIIRKDALLELKKQPMLWVVSARLGVISIT